MPAQSPLFHILQKLSSHNPQEVIQEIRSLPDYEKDLISYLSFDNYEIRILAARALGLLNAKKAIIPLCSALDANNYELQAVAAEALGKIGDKSVVDRLISTLNHDNNDVRAAVIKALANINYGDDTITKNKVYDILLGVFNNYEISSKVREAAFLGLVKFGCPSELIINALKDEDIIVANAAFKVAKDIVASGDSDIIEKLVGILEHEDEDYVEIVSELLITKGEDVIPILQTVMQNGSIKLKKKVLEILAEIKSDKTLPIFLDEIGDKNLEEIVKKVLIKRGEQAIEEIIIRLKNVSILDHSVKVLFGYLSMLVKEGYKLTQQQTVEIVEYLADSELYPDVKSFAKYKIFSNDLLYKIVNRQYSDRIRNCAAFLLGSERDSRCSERIVKIFREGTEYEWCIATEIIPHIINELPKEISDEVIDSLIEALKCNDVMKRVYAAYALGEIRERKALQPLIEMLNEKRGIVPVIWALGEIGDERAIPHLALLMNDDDPEIRESVVQSISKIGGKEAVEVLIKALADENEFVRVKAAWGLLNIGRPFIDRITRILSDPSRKVLAVWILGKMGANAEEETRTKIYNILNDSCDERTRETLRDALLRLGNISLNHFLERISIPECRECIRSALLSGSISFKKEAGDRLMEMIRHGDMNAAEVFEKSLALRYLPELIDLLKNKDFRKPAEIVILNIGNLAIESLTDAIARGNKEAQEVLDKILSGEAK